MNGDLIVEARSKDSLGNEYWREVSTLNHKENPVLFCLLAGPDALEGK